MATGNSPAPGLAGDLRPAPDGRAARRLAQAQHQVIAARQLLALGYTEAAIRHRVATGRLWPLMRGVYAVGPPRGTGEQRWMAAVLAAGPGAALSHRSAAALWGIGTEVPGRIDLSVRRRCRVRRVGLRARSRPTLAAEEIVERQGIPLTSIVQTLVDLATELPEGRLERAINEADKHDRVDPEALRAVLDRRRGEPGIKRLAALLDKRTFRLSDQELERLFRPIAAAGGVPVELTKAWVNDFEVDFYWPRLGLVVETDGLRYHRTPAEQARDRLRDQTHTAAGLTQLRFTHYQVKYEAGHVRAILSRTATRLSG
jgi:very-short-patch-repair endonuclease/predicted transcriptional regulator of viral defense system